MELYDPTVDFQFLSGADTILPEYFYQDPEKKERYYAWWDTLNIEEIEIKWFFRGVDEISQQNISLNDENETIDFTFKMLEANRTLLPDDTLHF